MVITWCCMNILNQAGQCFAKCSSVLLWRLNLTERQQHSGCISLWAVWKAWGEDDFNLSWFCKGYRLGFRRSKLIIPGTEAQVPVSVGKLKRCPQHRILPTSPVGAVTVLSQTQAPFPRRALVHLAGASELTRGECSFLPFHTHRAVLHF